MATTISLEELRSISSLLFKHLEETGQTQFVIDEDYYWLVPEDKRYDRYEEPQRHTVGQLSEDTDMLRRIFTGRQ